MEENEVILEILRVIVDGETKRNKLFDKALHIFAFSVLGLAIILSTANIILFANMFIR